MRSFIRVSRTVSRLHPFLKSRNADDCVVDIVSTFCESLHSKGGINAMVIPAPSLKPREADDS